jgi:hypothetical protein
MSSSAGFVTQLNVEISEKIFNQGSIPGQNGYGKSKVLRQVFIGDCTTLVSTFELLPLLLQVLVKELSERVWRCPR